MASGGRWSFPGVAPSSIEGRRPNGHPNAHYATQSRPEPYPPRCLTQSPATMVITASGAPARTQGPTRPRPRAQGMRVGRPGGHARSGIGAPRAALDLIRGHEAAKVGVPPKVGTSHRPDPNGHPRHPGFMKKVAPCRPVGLRTSARLRRAIRSREAHWLTSTYAPHPTAGRPHLPGSSTMRPPAARAH